jgi:hypothetical protein
MAEQIPISGPSQNQPPSPSIDHYKDLVKMAHNEIEWVQGKYKLAAGILGFLALVIFGAAALFIPKTIDDLKERIDKEAATTRSTIQTELDLHKRKAIADLADHLNKQIAEQFGTQLIQETLEKVAASEAKGIIEKKVEPVVDVAKKFVDNFRDEYNKKLEELGKEVDFQKQIRKIQDLQSSAILSCSLKALEGLQVIIDEPYEISRAKESAILAIKVHFSSEMVYESGSLRTLIRGVDVPFKDTSTNELLQKLASPDAYRVPIILALKDRRECGVPEALLKVVDSDPSLCVRTSAMKALSRLMYLPFGDVLSFGAPQAMYDQHKALIRKNFGCKDENP